MSDSVLSTEPVAAPRRPAFAARALEPSAAFWFSMFAASALGTNVGDFFAETLSLGLVTSFATLAVICALMVWGDREKGQDTEIFFWLAIVFLRAVATNVGDFLTHALAMNYLMTTVLLGAATLAAGRFTRPGREGGVSPQIDLHYWGAMFCGGVFGTVGGDLASHTFGLFFALVLLVVVLVAVLRARQLAAPTAMVGYWCIVLAERAAGTPAGDWLDSKHGLALGLPVAMTITGALLLIGLGARSQRMVLPSLPGQAGFASLALVAGPVLRLVLLILSLLGAFVMLQIYFVERPREPLFVLSFAGGLVLNAFYLGAHEFSGLTNSRAVRLVRLWFAAQRRDYDLWASKVEEDLRRRLE